MATIARKILEEAKKATSEGYGTAQMTVGDEVYICNIITSRRGAKFHHRQQWMKNHKASSKAKIWEELKHFEDFAVRVCASGKGWVQLTVDRN